MIERLSRWVGRVRCQALILGAVVVGAAQAGELAVPWFHFPAGGGVSGGGEYVLVGALGEASAGAELAGGGYTLRAGFVPGLGPVPGTPALTIALGGAGQIRLGWEDPGGLHVLQQSGSLEASGWVDVPGGGTSPLTVNSLAEVTYYRLRRR